MAVGPVRVQRIAGPYSPSAVSGSRATGRARMNPLENMTLADLSALPAAGRRQAGRLSSATKGPRCAGAGLPARLDFALSPTTPFRLIVQIHNLAGNSRCRWPGGALMAKWVEGGLGPPVGVVGVVFGGHGPPYLDMRNRLKRGTRPSPEGRGERAPASRRLPAIGGVRSRLALRPQST